MARMPYLPSYKSLELRRFARVQEPMLSKVLVMLFGDKLPLDALAEHIQNTDPLSTRIPEVHVVLLK